jgi:hypothetical protein
MVISEPRLDFMMSIYIVQERNLATTVTSLHRRASQRHGGSSGNLGFLCARYSPWRLKAAHTSLKFGTLMSNITQASLVPGVWSDSVPLIDV